MADPDALYQALADPTRRLILDGLRERDGQSLFEICVRLSDQHHVGITRQAISKHLALLEEAGLVRTEWQGRTKLHRLDPEPLRQAYRSWLRHYVEKDEK